MTEKIAKFAAMSNRYVNTDVTDFDKVYMGGKIVFTGAFVPKKTFEHFTIDRIFGNTRGFAVVYDNLILSKALYKTKEHLTYEAEAMQFSKNLTTSVVRSLSIFEYPFTKVRNALRVKVDGVMYILVQIDKMDTSDFPNMYLKPYKTIVIKEIDKEEGFSDSLNRSFFGTSGYSVYPHEYNSSKILKSQVLVSKEYQELIAKSAAYVGGLIDRYGKKTKELKVDSLYNEPLITVQWYREFNNVESEDGNVTDVKYQDPTPFAIMHMVSRQDDNIRSAVQEIWYMALDGSGVIYKYDVSNLNIIAPSSYSAPILKGDDDKSYNNSDYRITKLVALPNSKGERFIIATISAIDENGEINSISTIAVAIRESDQIRKILKPNVSVQKQINDFDSLSS